MINEMVAQIVATLGTAICFAFLSLKVVLLIVNLFRFRSHSIPYIRNYKKVSFISNYLLMMLIYFIGILYGERNLFAAFSSSVTSAADFLVLKFNTENINALMEYNPLYTVSVYGGYGLVVFGAVLFTMSLMQQYLWSARKAFSVKITRKEKMYLFGYNPDNISICESDGKRRFKYIVAKIGKEEREKLYIDNIPYLLVDPENWFAEHLKSLLRWGIKKSIFIINTGDDKQNIALCKKFTEQIASASDQVKDNIFSKVSIFVFGDPKYHAIYENLTKKGLGCINYINKYQKIAMDFIDRYPLTLFMNENQIDYSTSLIRDGVDINVALIGFGKTNRQIFLTSVASNQFLKSSEKGPEHKRVKYFIFDKDHSEQNKNLNHDYYRFKKKLETINPMDYLDMPSLPAEEQYFHMDINDCEFYGAVKDMVTKNPKDANFIVISFGNDLENLDMAHKLVEKCNEWDVKNVTIFVRAFGWCKKQTPLENKNCYFFGNENDVVFDIDKMLSDKLYCMAKMRSEVFDLERAITDETESSIDDAFVSAKSVEANENWYKEKSQMQRDSSLYACLSLRFKLNLMGLDYCKEETKTDSLTEEEYMQIYAGCDRPDIEKYNRKIKGKNIVYYGIDYPMSRRRNMAIQEHHRWTSFVISRGMVPATREQIRSEIQESNGVNVYTDGTNYDLRHHGNLTSYEGLVEFRKILAERDAVSEEKKDRMRFRYQILDDAYWLLNSNGFKIVKKRPYVEEDSEKC